MKPLRVLVVGASCQIGHFLLPLLRDQGVEVHAVSRGSRDASDGVTWHRGDLPDRMPVPAGIDGIISCGPIDALAAWLSRLDQRPAAGVVATSSMSVLTKRGSLDEEERVLVERLAAGEHGVQQACERLGMAWSLIRPTLIYGAGMDRSLTPIAHRAMRWRTFPLPRGRGLRQPVHAADVAEAAWRALRTPEAAGRVFELGGGERLASGEMFSRLRDSLHCRTLGVHLGRIPLALLPRLLPAARGPVSRLDRDLVADNSQVRGVLGLEPRGFALDASMWSRAGERR